MAILSPRYLNNIMINVSSVKLLQQHIIIPYTRAGAVNNNITSSGNVGAFVQKEMDFEFVFTYICVHIKLV